MMISGKILVADELLARKKAFFLLKKWTSARFLNKSVDLYRNFLDVYQRNLDRPSINQAELEGYFVYSFLPRMVDFERGLAILLQGVDKMAAYCSFMEGRKFAGGMGKRSGLHVD